MEVIMSDLRPINASGRYVHAYKQITSASQSSIWQTAFCKIKIFGDLVASAAIETFSFKGAYNNLKHLSAKLRGKHSETASSVYEYTSKIFKMLSLNSLKESQKKALVEIDHLKALNPALAERYQKQALYLFTQKALEMGQTKHLIHDELESFFIIKLKQLPATLITKELASGINFFIYQMGHDELSFSSFEKLEKKTQGFRVIESRMDSLMNLLVQTAKNSLSIDAPRLKMQFRFDNFSIGSFQELKIASPSLTVKAHVEHIFKAAKSYYLKRDYSESEAIKIAAMLLYSASQAGQAGFVGYMRSVLSKYTSNPCACFGIPIAKALYHKTIDLNGRGFRVVNKQTYDFIDYDLHIGQTHTPFEVSIETAYCDHQLETKYVFLNVNIETLKVLIRQDIEKNLLFYFKGLRRQLVLNTLSKDYITRFTELFNQEKFYTTLESNLKMESVKPLKIFASTSLSQDDVKELGLPLEGDHLLLHDSEHSKNILVSPFDLLELPFKNLKKGIKKIKKIILEELVKEANLNNLEVYLLGENIFQKTKKVSFKDIVKLFRKLKSFYVDQGKGDMAAICHALEPLSSLTSSGLKRDVIPQLKHKVELFNDHLNLSRREDWVLGFFDLVPPVSKEKHPRQLYIYKLPDESVSFGIRYMENLQLLFVPNVMWTTEYRALESLSEKMSYVIPFSVYMEADGQNIKIQVKKYVSPLEEVLEAY